MGHLMDWVSIYIIPIGATFGAISWFYVMEEGCADGRSRYEEQVLVCGRSLFYKLQLILCLVALFMKVAF